MPWTGIAAAGVSALASAGSSFAASKMNHKSFKRNIEMMKLQSKLNQRQYAWQMDNYLSPLAQRRLFENAGLNINEITRSGQSMMNAGQLGGVSNPGGGQMFAPDFSGLAQAGGHIAQAVVRSKDAKLKAEQATTEEKKRFVMDTTASLNKAYEGNQIAQTAYQNVVNEIASATKDEKIKQSFIETKEGKLRLDTMSKNLAIMAQQLADWVFKVQVMNPATALNAIADYYSTVALAGLTFIKQKVATQQASLIAQQVKTEFYRSGQAKEYMKYWQDLNENDFAGVQVWGATTQAQQGERNYNWTPAMNIIYGIDKTTASVARILGMYLQYKNRGNKDSNSNTEDFTQALSILQQMTGEEAFGLMLEGAAATAF